MFLLIPGAIDFGMPSSRFPLTRKKCTFEFCLSQRICFRVDLMEEYVSLYVASLPSELFVLHLNFSSETSIYPSFFNHLRSAVPMSFLIFQKVLFSSTEKGRIAIVRQINPSIHVEGTLSVAQELRRFLPRIEHSTPQQLPGLIQTLLRI